MIKVLFLDIDGVLNSNFWNVGHQREISDGTLIDEEKIKLLALLVKRTNAKIILHSGWRTWFDSELKPLRVETQRLLELLDREGLCIDGVTPDLTTEEIRKTKKFSMVKADEILYWLKAHKDVSKWVVLDDLDLHNAQVEQHQVKPDSTIGLTVEDIEKAENLLN
ncbi:MAG: HAD domain-containing protein [Butyrivibrio sp.]|nr:HAD domain-containing protein [Butyrivibrio sp.]